MKGDIDYAAEKELNLLEDYDCVEHKERSLPWDIDYAVEKELNLPEDYDCVEEERSLPGGLRCGKGAKLTIG